MTQRLIADYSYLAVFLLMTAESACIPIPSELVMVFGGALAAGAMPGVDPTIALIVAAGVAGNVVGSYLAWALGRYGGQAAWRRWGSYIWLRASDLDRTQRWFARYGARAVLIGRILPAVRTFISLPAGISAMPPLRFGVYTFVGCLPWNAALAGAGYALDREWQVIARALHGPTYIISGAIGVFTLAGLAVFFRRRRTTVRREPAVPDSSEPAAKHH